MPAGATFVCCLFIRLELGIVIGIGINLLFLLYATARPTLRVDKATVSFTTSHKVRHGGARAFSPNLSRNISTANSFRKLKTAFSKKILKNPSYLNSDKYILFIGDFLFRCILNFYYLHLYRARARVLIKKKIKLRQESRKIFLRHISVKYIYYVLVFRASVAVSILS